MSVTVSLPSVECRSLIYSRHAIERMLERRIDPSEVRAVVEQHEIVEEDPTDRPYPSYLLLAMVGGRALHVVLGYDSASRTGYVVTTYVPEPEYWNPDWKTRRPR